MVIKTAQDQYADNNDLELVVLDDGNIEVSSDDEDDFEVSSDEETNEEAVEEELPVGEEVEYTDEEEPVVFVVDEVPGAPEAGEVVMDEHAPEAVEEGENDPWKWNHAGFIPWLQKMIKNIPSHSGKDTTGLEKAISYFEAIDREISKAMRTDYRNEIDSAHAEKAREEIENGLERLIERLETVKTTKYKRHAKKAKGWAEDLGIVKEGGTTRISGITITVPLLISRIARVCINGAVSAGHDLEDMFQQQVKEYDLDKREQAELAQLLSDMNFPIRQDRGLPLGQPVDQTRSDNFDWAAQYSS